MVRAMRRMLMFAIGLAALILAGAAARAQDAQYLVGAWQGWTAEPVTGGPVAYSVIIYPNGTYYRTYRPQMLRGGVDDAGRYEIMGNVIHFTIQQYREIPDRGAPPPRGDAYVFAFNGPNQLVLTIHQCRLLPQLCVIQLQRAN